jgi:hypothetical protein
MGRFLCPRSVYMIKGRKTTIQRCRQRQPLRGVVVATMSASTLIGGQPTVQIGSSGDDNLSQTEEKAGCGPIVQYAVLPYHFALHSKFFWSPPGRPSAGWFLRVGPSRA